MDNIVSILPGLRGIFLNELAELINRYNKISDDRKNAIKGAVDLLNRLIDSQKSYNYRADESQDKQRRTI